MSNINRLNQIFIDTLRVENSALNSQFNAQTVEKWDSVIQLTLVSGIEDEFDIYFESEEILEMDSYDKAKSIVIRHGIDLSL